MGVVWCSRWVSALVGVTDCLAASPAEVQEVDQPVPVLTAGS